MPAHAGSPLEQGAVRRRFASPDLRALLRRRLMEFCGLLAALVALGLAAALLSYDAADPSLNTATSRPVGNLAGPAGAIVADILLQCFGYAAALTVLALLAWAFRLATQRGLGFIPSRLLGLALGLPLGAAALSLARLPPEVPSLAGAGGAFGPMLADGMISGLAGVFGPFGAVLAKSVIVSAAVVTAFFGCGLSFDEWRGAGRATLGASRAALAAARARAERLRPTGETEAKRQGFLARLAARFNSGTGRLFRRQEPEIPLGPMLRAADAAAEAMPIRPEAPGAGREAPPVRPRKEAEPARRPAQQPALDFGDGAWALPPLDLLTAAPTQRVGRPSEESLQANARLLESVLEDYGVRGRIVEIRPGPVVTLYELEPAPGTKSARVIGLADDIARSMSLIAVRIATVPGRNVIGIEMPNAKRETVFLSEMFSDESWHRHQGKLPLALGKDISGAPVIADLARMPHLLIAGTTGSGKSVGINTMILSLLYRFSPDECRFIMIDPKMLELSVYDRIPHLLAPVVTEPAKAIGALKWTVREMERRYRAMSQLGVRNIAGYNEKVTAARQRGEVLTRRVQTGFDPETNKPVFEDQPLALEALPMIVVVIDEMADLMIVAGKEIEAAVQRLAQMARAAGIHVIMATQRPSVDVITGTIKANFPTRISFQVTSKIDSRTILGEQGAEQLLGQGDMLHMPGGGRVARVHGPFVSDTEVERIVEFLRAQGEPAYVDEVTETEDEDDSVAMLGMLGGNTDAEGSLYDQAVALVTREGKASTSFVQRHLNIGYNRAAKLIEQMEREGVVGPANHVGKREVLAPGPRE
ncbi:MAG: DNA translocase FtsK 4TM domain-containing protein [Roseomonas sp.]|nr:DNA translocase FtsK 4TM domain-containing protein [Roseomonas sp.]MCA3326251.1 DNA translocase FtsK 4TM domain-containing protein [Roseomonas sp.]MCA3332904.1 DNA translocase FtsK 4TM domain-containing protein [Roseomonas sp.]MCA3333896.1 DNA translocase FtsK 4TM domain-containing protein [Roseomonas sp.]MCA3348654.1 DNA translocase FtsK 4TM domain-containing protein [Roseomonas sp.]